MAGKKRHDVYVEPLWKGVARNTLLEPQLHISNLKPTTRHHDKHIYPLWWGHEEYHQEKYSLALSKRKYENKRVIADEKGASGGGGGDSLPPAGLKTQKEPITILPVVCEHWPKKMVDENTQTDDALLPINIPMEHRKPPLASKIPVPASYSGFMGGAVATSPDRTTAATTSRVIPKSASRAAKKFVPRVSAASSKKVEHVSTDFISKMDAYNTSSILTELSPTRAGENVSHIASSLKETTETLLKIKTAPSLSKSEKMVLKENYKPDPPPKSISPSFSEKIPPPLDGVYALATNFLNGPIVQLLDIDDGSIAFNIAESLLLDSKSFWLDDAIADISQNS